MSDDNGAGIWQDVVSSLGTQSEVATVLGVSQTLISYHCRKGTLVPAEWCEALSKATGIPVKKLRPDLKGILRK